MLDAITPFLASIEAHGSFFARTREPPKNLHLEVKGVGTIPLPVSPTMARKLLSVAKQAPYGLRDKTVLDAKVRDTWQIARSRIKSDKRQWNKTLHPQLRSTQNDLGLPVGGKLQAELYKLLVYEPGQFFRPHQDSEKLANMVGTMTVELPSDYRGGSTIVEHRGQKITFRRSKHSAEHLTFTAFYSDCHHEVRPITEGYRIVLVYNLTFAGAPLELDQDMSTKVSVLKNLIDNHFSTPTPPHKYAQKTTNPDKLVYLLDHEYSQESLAWDRLKNGDRLRAAAMQAVANQEGYDIFLTQADVHEVWACEDDYHRYERDWHRRGYRYEEEKELAPIAAHPALTELVNDEICLRHWIDASGKPITPIDVRVADNELYFTKATQDCNPFASEHEGYTGNAGNTVDRWYHRAAIVVWPRKMSLIIRAEADPEWAIGQLSGVLKEEGAEDARKMARTLLLRWQVASIDAPRGFLTMVLRVADGLHEAELAAGLLHPFELGQLDTSSTQHLASLVNSHGVSWARDLMQQWFSKSTSYSGYVDQDWLHLMPALCRGLHQEHTPACVSLAKWLVAHQWAQIKPHCESLLSNSYRLPDQSSLDDLSKTAVNIVAACVVAGCDATHLEIMAFLTDSKHSVPLSALVACLRHAQKTRTAKELKKLKLTSLLKYCHDELATATAAKPRSSNDWSITPPPNCPSTLREFLSSSTEEELVWPLAKQGRRGSHNIIDGYKLPVKHTTLRAGSPHKLVLKKTLALFARELDLREMRKAEFQWLLSHRHRF